MNGIQSKWLRAIALAAQLSAATLAGAQGIDSASEWTARLRQRGFSAEQADRAVACLAEGRRQGIPAAVLSRRLDEGLAKNVEPSRLLDALQSRLDTMVRARAMLLDARYDPASGSACEGLLAATGLALESGVPAEDLAAILGRGNGQSAARIQGVVEAGETLRLAGIDSATARQLMDDCLDRDLRRMEMLRAVRFAVQQHRGGMEGGQIRKSLWGGSAAVEGPQGRRGAGGERPGASGVGRGTAGQGGAAAPGAGSGGGRGQGAGGVP
jgi:hypothetical protein